MTESQHAQRIQDLQAHLDLVCGLLAEIERAQLFTHDPTDKKRYTAQIAEHKQQPLSKNYVN